MRRAEGVVHVQVAVVGELAREALVVLRLPRVEARVLEHAQALVGQELAQPRFDGAHRVRGVLPLRAAQVRADDDLCRVALEQQLKRRQRGADPRVVGDPPVLEGDVEVGAHEHALAGHVSGSDRAGAPHSAGAYAATGSGSAVPTTTCTTGSA